MFEPLLAIADMIGDIHPLAKGIVGSFKAIHNVLKGVSQLNKEICALIEDMCLMLRHLDKIKSSMKGNETEELRLILLKMENVMSHTCQFVQNWHDSKRKKGALLTSLSREQVQGIRRLQAQFSDVKSDLDRGIAVDTFVRTRVLSDKLDTIPFPSMQNSIYYSKKDEMGDSEAPPSYDSWGVNPKADSLYTD
ncbi:hypothetical protein K435DRAFT_775187 [Dendrothele bispora CBS 962.96]|uniref:Uncharacterized protein n=1 Tax=Dendrothele bispora (strain CBS 962.96) TaxID=1314807 RepID=A0A4S8MKA7_DENBC|nr:hypothetical protein K435DRAFT_775187 [Dendrothele bispora CBS 962.96]